MSFHHCHATRVEAGCSDIDISLSRPQVPAPRPRSRRGRPPPGPTAGAADRPRSAGSRARGSGRPSARRPRRRSSAGSRRRRRARSLIAPREALRRERSPPYRSSRATLEQVRRVLARDHERVPARGGSDVHEGDRALVFVDDRRRQLARDDLAEDAVWVAHRAEAYWDGSPAAQARARRTSACSRVSTSPAYCASRELLEQRRPVAAPARSRARAPAHRRAAAASAGPPRASAARRRASPRPRAGAPRSPPARDRRASPAGRRSTAASRRPRPGRVARR